MSSTTLASTWNNQKQKVVLISALLPLIWILFSGIAVYVWPSFPIFNFATALVMYQLSLLIVLVNELATLISKRSSIRVTGITLHANFWESRRGNQYRKVAINAMNGDVIFRMLEAHNIRVKEIRIIVPTATALTTYFKNNAAVANPKNAIDDQLSLIANISYWRGLLRKGDSSQFEIKRIGSFPLDFYVIFDSRYCLTGKYVTDQSRKNKIGLKSSAWIEEDSQIVDHLTQHFDALWGALPDEQHA